MIVRRVIGYRIIGNMRLISSASVFLVISASGFGQSADPVIASSERLFTIAKTDVLKSVDKVSDELWTYQPTPQVRTFGQLFAHIADGQYEFCSAAVEPSMIDKGVEKKLKTKAEVVAALKDAFAYCEKSYASLTKDRALETVKAFGGQMTRISVMDFNAAHTMEHYGNLVTYMRLKGIVPPTSKQ
jgi:uncharacterized damage-inducible protein DinB